MTNINPIAIESHPPERRRRTETLMCGCCCCCCCCLHTVGGLIGAAVAPAFGKNSRAALTYYYDEEFDIAIPNIGRSGVSAVKVFWLLTLACTLLAVFLSLALAIDDPGEGFVIGMIILALLFPAVQLGCAILVLLWLAMSSREDRGAQMKQVGKITLGLFLGTLAGILTMVVVGVMMS